eukprot:TRINITY_DN38402_c0_g1_i1.p1 TRINITY_DN38402_c0_g1~~TRINITY_DN38402_c0_g1_i1.p1  ORF type:complete len:473 (+),score=90.29 TRINITY_DN38402_c0_g1_i1:128-1546(+)
MAAAEHASTKVQQALKVLHVDAHQHDEEIKMTGALDLVLSEIYVWFRDYELTSPAPRSWASSVLVLRGRPKVGAIFVVIALYHCIVVTAVQVGLIYVGGVEALGIVMTGVAGAGGDDGGDDGGGEERRLAASVIDTPLKAVLLRIMTLNPSPIRFTCVGLLFLLAYRTQTSYQKWMQARTQWTHLHTQSRDLAMQFSSYVKDFDSVQRACRLIVLYILTLRNWLRGTPVEQHLFDILLTPEEIKMFQDELRIMQTEEELKIQADPGLSWHFKVVNAPVCVLQALRDEIRDCVDRKHIGPFHMALDNSVKALETQLSEAEAVMSTKMPFGYVSHLRTTLLFFLFLMPLFLVKDLGWSTIITVCFFSFVVTGLENLAVEIENPFGSDANDLPMERYCAEIARDVRDILHRRRKREQNMKALNLMGDTLNDELTTESMADFLMPPMPAEADSKWSIPQTQRIVLTGAVCSKEEQC